MYTVQCAVYTVQCMVHSIWCRVYSAQYMVYSVQSTVYGVQCTVHSIWCTVYSAQYLCNDGVGVESAASRAGGDEACDGSGVDLHGSLLPAAGLLVAVDSGLRANGQSWPENWRCTRKRKTRGTEWCRPKSGPPNWFMCSDCDEHVCGSLRCS